MNQSHLKIVFAAAIGLGIGVAAMALRPTADKVDVEQLRAKVVERLDGQALVGRVAPSPIKSLYEIEFKSGGVGYVDASGRYFLLAPMVDSIERKVASQFVQAAGVVSGVNVQPTAHNGNEQTLGGVAPTANHANTRVDVTNLKGGITWTNGNGKRRAIVFSDPHCPFCKQLDQVLRDASQLPDTTVEIYPYPIRTLHPKAAPASAWAICQSPSARATAWKAIVDGDAFGAADADCEKKIAAIEALGESWGIQSTPTVLAPNGARVSGALSGAELVKFLDANAK